MSSGLVSFLEAVIVSASLSGGCLKCSICKVIKRSSILSFFTARHLFHQTLLASTGSAEPISYVTP